ncbi:MAG: hypothetical protein RLZZ135_1324, partial [Cyanobacteriota bacterium]
PPLVKIERPAAQSQPSQYTTTPIGQKLPVSAQLTIGRQSIGLEVVRTPEQQEIGLMYRTELAKDRGMLFVFNPPRPARFWMKNTLIPLDMIFMSNGVVKDIRNNIPPCKTDPCPSYGPDTKIDIDSVIELPAGRATELKLKVGARLKIAELKLKG